MHISKGKLRFSSKDMWNADLAIKSVIVTFLKQYKEVKKYSVAPHVSDTIEPSVYEKYTEKQHEEEWNKLLDEMIFGFENHPDYSDLNPIDFRYNNLTNPEMFEEIKTEHPKYGTCYQYQSKLKPGFTEQDVIDYMAASKEYDKQINERVKKSRELFIRYLDHLWI